MNFKGAKMNSMQKLTDLRFSDLLGDNKKLVFLTGAGSSIESPSSMPSARKVMETLIKYTCVKSEIEKILQIEELKFEILIEIFQDTFDKELSFANFYLENDKPNIIHFFLAEMLKKGHFLMTSNFDSLVEHALLKLNIQKKKIVPVITERDYEKFKDPNKLLKNAPF